MTKCVEKMCTSRELHWPIQYKNVMKCSYNSEQNHIFQTSIYLHSWMKHSLLPLWFFFMQTVSQPEKGMVCSSVLHAVAHSFSLPRFFYMKGHRCVTWHQSSMIGGNLPFYSLCFCSHINHATELQISLHPYKGLSSTEIIHVLHIASFFWQAGQSSCELLAVLMCQKCFHLFTT